MRTLAAGLLMLLPTLGAAFDWTGSAGLLYSRSDRFPEGGERISIPHLDLDLRLLARGTIGGPGIFIWSGEGGYRRISDSLNGTRTTLNDAFTYRLSGLVLQNKTSPFQLSLQASRTDSTLENLVNGGTFSGDSTVTRYGAHALFRFTDVPTVRTGYEFLQSEERLPGLSIQRERESHLARVGLGHAAGGAAINMRFDGDWTTGTWDSDNYDQYIVVADGHSRITARGDLFFNDQYTHREPTIAAATVWGYELNSFNAGYREGMIPGDTLVASYRSLHSMIEAGGASTETLSHAVRYEQDFRLGESKYFLRPLADVTYREQRLPTETVTSSGETARCLLWWRKAADATLLEWNAGPAIGLLQMPGEATRVGYGAAAAVRFSGPWLTQRASVGYEAEWRSDIFGQRGWSIRQQGSAGLNGAGLGGSYSVQAAASAYRSWTPTQGDNAQRNLQLSATLYRQKYSAEALVAFSSGSAPTVAGGDFVGDGFFLPVGFASHNLSAQVAGNAEIVRNLRGRLQLRTAASNGSGQPEFSYVEAGAALTYRYGAFDLQLEDRYQRSLLDPPSPPVNLLMLRVSRTIGSRY